MNDSLRSGTLRFGTFAVVMVACGGEPSPSSDDVGETSRAGEHRDAETTTALRALFGRYRARVTRDGDSAPERRALFGESALAIALPERADGSFRLEARGSALAISVSLVGARAAAVERAGTYALYREATRDGAALVQNVTESGLEDYVELPARPAGDAVAYDVKLEAGVAGLRLVGGGLELLDALGVPRLRVTPPVVIGSDGSVSKAELGVEGCAVDTDPRAPWGRPTVAPGAERCRVAVRFEGSAVAYPALLDPVWNGVGSLGVPRTGAQAVLLRSGKVLVAGGRGFDGTPLDSAELYDPATRSWSFTAGLATARADFTLTVRPNGQALAAGGRDTEASGLASTELYDAGTGKWSEGPAFSVPHADHRAVVLTTGDVLVAGGTSAAAEKLSSVTSTWSSAGTLQSAVTRHTLTALASGRALLVGGAQPQTYEPTGSRWLPAPGSSVAVRQGHTATRLAGGQVLVIDDQSPTAELFDPAAGTWSRPGASVTRRSGHSATLLSDGRVLVVGGAPAGTPAFLASELYTPAYGTFAPGPAMLAPRREHVDVPLPNGKVLLAGGSDPSGEFVLGDAEEFDPRPLAATTAEYKLPAGVDPEVLSDRATELWASVTRPATLAPGQRYPLLVFLHGNHGTCGTGSNPRHDYNCQYTDTGTCPAGYVVTPNHRGYDYIANELAGRGFVVVSINANRGINCAGGAGDDFGLNLARGRLILRHLEQLSAWNRGAAATPASLGVSLRGLLDFGEVGLLGHSRGGEGVRAAYEQYHDAGSPWPARIVEPLDVRAVFEIGPVDGQSSRVLNASGATWNVLLPMCDGDVADLEGVKPFDRMIQDTTAANVGPKSTYAVWGANHNFYNTEWQDSDSFGCTDHRPIFSPLDTGSAEQRQTAMRAVVSFFVGNVGDTRTPELEDLFNPELRVSYDSPVQRGYAPEPALARVLEEFKNAAGTSTAGVRNVHSHVTVAHGNLPEHDATLRGATVTWSTPGTSTYFQIDFANSGAGVDLSGYELLDFRVDRPKGPANVAPSTSYEVALVNADDSVTTLVSPDAFADPVVGPVGGPYGNYHEMLQTVRLPLASFASANLAAIRGVRFVFRKTPTGTLFLANVRATRSTLLEVAGQPNAAPVATTPNVTATPRALATATRVTSGNAIVSLRSASGGQAVELRLSTGTPFLPRAEVLELEIGGAKSVLSRHPSGNLSEVVFVVNKAVFDALPDGQPVRVHYAGKTGTAWEFGALDKRTLDH